MKFKLIFIFTLIIMPQLASALSCMEPNIINSFNVRSKSDKIYFMAYGKFSANQPLPKRDINSSIQIIPEDITRKLKFSGMGIGTKVDAELTNISVDVTNACLAHWCGGWPPLNKEITLFIEKDNVSNSFKYTTSPCGGTHFIGNTKSNVRKLRNCLENGCPEKRQF